MQYMVYNITSPNITYANSTYADVLAADRIDPGQQNAMNPDLRPFVKRNGKLLHYVGWADHLIAPTNSVRYFVANIICIMAEELCSCTITHLLRSS
jgi:feruloyl esterase